MEYWVSHPNVKQKGSFELLRPNKLESRWPQIKLCYFLPMHRYKSYKKNQIIYSQNKLYSFCTFEHNMNKHVTHTHAS